MTRRRDLYKRKFCYYPLGMTKTKFVSFVTIGHQLPVAFLLKLPRWQVEKDLLDFTVTGTGET